MSFGIARENKDGKLSFFSTGEFLRDLKFATTWPMRSEAVSVARTISRPTLVLDLASQIVPTGDGGHAIGSAECFFVRVNEKERA